MHVATIVRTYCTPAMPTKKRAGGGGSLKSEIKKKNFGAAGLLHSEGFKGDLETFWS